MEDKIKKEKEQEQPPATGKEEKTEQPVSRADNAAKQVNSGRSQSKKDRQVKDKVTGAEFEGPPY